MTNSYQMKIGIIGGKGQMGSWFNRFFTDLGITVLISDIDTTITNQELIKTADVVLFSVPIGETVKVIEENLIFTHPEQLLMDITSLKVEPLKSLMRSQSEVIGLHPMFGPDTESMKDQVIVACEGRSGERAKAILNIFRSSGGRIKITSAEDHDRAMAIIQGLNHFSTIALAHCIKNLGIDVKDTLAYASPIYKIRMDMVGRILNQDPRLYGEISINNPLAIDTISAFVNSSKTLQEIISSKDLKAFISYFKEASDHLGSFREEATRESNSLIKTLSDPKS